MESMGHHPEHITGFRVSVCFSRSHMEPFLPKFPSGKLLQEQKWISCIPGILVLYLLSNFIPIHLHSAHMTDVHVTLYRLPPEFLPPSARPGKFTIFRVPVRSLSVNLLVPADCASPQKRGSSTFHFHLWVSEVTHGREQLIRRMVRLAYSWREQYTPTQRESP